MNVFFSTSRERLLIICPFALQKLKLRYAVTCSCVLSVCRLVQESCRLREFRCSASSCSFRWSHASWVWDNLECRACCSATTNAFCRREISQWSIRVTRRQFCVAQKQLFFFLRDFYIMSLPKETKIQHVNAEKATLWSTRAVIRCLAYNLCTGIHNHHQQICKGFSVCWLQSALINGCGCVD